MQFEDLDIPHLHGFRSFLSQIEHDGQCPDDKDRASKALSSLMRDLSLGDIPNYNDHYIAAAYIVKYHLSQCVLAYTVFKEFFSLVGFPDTLYVYDVGAGTGAGRVGLALALSECPEAPTVYFDAYEPSAEMLSAGSCFWSSLPKSLTSHVPDCTYRGGTTSPVDVPANLNGVLRIVTAFHVSLPYDSAGYWNNVDESAQHSIRFALRLVSPDAGLFTCHKGKINALNKSINFFDWSDSLSGDYDSEDDNGVPSVSPFYNYAADLGFEIYDGKASVRSWSRYRFSLPKDFSLMLRISSLFAKTLSREPECNTVPEHEQQGEKDNRPQPTTQPVVDQNQPSRQRPQEPTRAGGSRRKSNALERVRPHSVVHGTVIHVEYDKYDPDRVQHVIIQIIGAPCEGKVDARELERLPEELQQDLREEGFSRDFFVEWVPRQAGADAFCELTVSGLWHDEDWQKAHMRFKSGDAFPVRPVGYNKGGLLARFGRTLDGFIPLSHIGNFPRQRDPAQREEALHQLVQQDRELTVTVIEVDPAKRKLVLSNRNAERARTAESQQARLAALQVGSAVTGTVCNIRDFGAFVDIGGIEGLLHISEIDRDWVRHPGDFLTEGESVEVKILQVDLAKGHIKLSRKALTETPWTQVPARYHVGDIVWVDITRKKDFGAFARLQPGVEGLIHITEIAPEYEANPMSTIREGDRVEVKIIRIDIPNRRIGLSRKRVLERADRRQGSVT